MDPKLRALWLRVFDSDRDDPSQRTRTCLAGVRHLGIPRLEAGLRRWIAMLTDDPEPALALPGVVVLRHVISLCDMVGGRACDELLYDIARARWTHSPGPSWVPAYLWAVGRRPDDRAFACLEALVMNPATATDHAQRQYHALLAVFGASSLPTAGTGVDGFPLDREPAFRAQQTRIDQLLRMASRAASPRKSDPLPRLPIEALPAIAAMEDAIVREFSSDPVALHHCAVIRLDWIRAHKHEHPKDSVDLWRQTLLFVDCEGGLVQRSLARVDSLPFDSLLEAIRTGAGNSRIFDLCRKYVAANGWRAGLVEAMRKWIPTLGVAAGSQTLRAQVEWFLWFEDIAPVQPDACWSQRVKQDLRGMPAAERAAWVALLENSTFIISGKPPKKWLSAGEEAFRKVDGNQFRARFVDWFAPFGRSDAVRLTVTGRNLLRLLIWYALIARDAAVDEALAGFANARWKTKDTAQRAAQAEMAFAYVLSERAPEVALPILERLVTTGHAFQGSTTHRVYQDLCARRNRKPLPASPQKGTPAQDPPPNPVLDDLTVR
jgi:hypothetical protein